MTMAESKIRDENYFQVTGWMLNRLNLKGTALLVYAIIYGFSQDGESSFSGSLRYLCDFTGASKNTVMKALKDLVEQGHVLKTENQVNGVKFCTYQAAPVVQKLHWGGAEIELGGGAETAPGGGAETAPNNKSLDNKGSDNKRDKKAPDPMPETDNLFGTELQAAFDDWLRYKIERKDSYTPTGLTNLIGEIRNNAAKHGEEAVAALIRKCIAAGWKGIIFEKLTEEQPKQSGYRRREPVPGWMNPNDMGRYVKNFHDEQKKTVGEDPALAARAEGLRQRLQGN